MIMERCPEMFGGMSEEKRRKILLEGLRRAVWPGRMEILSEDPFLLVDGAHNPQGVAALAESLRAGLSRGAVPLCGGNSRGQGL